MTAPDPDLLDQLVRETRGKIDERMVQLEAEQTGLTPTQVVQANLQIIWARAGRDGSAFAARTMLYQAISDMELARRARYKALGGTEDPDFLDFESDAGKERRKLYFAATAAARAGLAEARKHYLHATILTQHIGAEELSRARSLPSEDAQEAPAEGEGLTGIAARSSKRKNEMVEIVDAHEDTPGQRRTVQNQTKRLNRALLDAEKAESEFEESLQK